MDSLKAKTISSLFWKFFERCGASFVQLLVQIVLARLLSPEDFGMLAIMLVFINLGNLLVQSGLNTSLVQVRIAKEIDYSTVFWVSLLLAFVIYVVVFSLAPYIAAFYASEELLWPLRILAILFVINAFNSVQVAIVQRKLEFRKLFFSTLGSVIVSGILGITLAFCGFGLWSLIVQQLSYQLLNCLLLLFQVKWFPKLLFSKKCAKKHFVFGWKLLASSALNTAYESLSDLIIGKQFSTNVLGLVSQGKKYPMALSTILNGTIQVVMLSTVSRIQNDKGRVKRLVRRALKTSTFLIVPFMTIIAVSAEPLVSLVLGSQWLPCVPFFQIYCIYYMFNPIHSTNLQALNGIGRSDLFLKLEIVKKLYAVPILLIVAFVFQDIYLLLGSYILTSIISTFVNAWPIKKVIGYSYYEQLRDILPAFLMAGFSAVCVLPIGCLDLPDLVLFLIEALAAILIYLTLAMVFKVEPFMYLIGTARELLRRNT